VSLAFSVTVLSGFLIAYIAYSFTNKICHPLRLIATGVFLYQLTPQTYVFVDSLEKSLCLSLGMSRCNNLQSTSRMEAALDRKACDSPNLTFVRHRLCSPHKHARRHRWRKNARSPVFLRRMYVVSNLETRNTATNVKVQHTQAHIDDASRSIFTNILNVLQSNQASKYDSSSHFCGC
jgi:hypothetical protein